MLVCFDCGYMKSLVTKRDKGQSDSICLQNPMYPFDISYFANKWKRDCIFLSIVDVFAGVTQFFHFGLYRVW